MFLRVFIVHVGHGSPLFSKNFQWRVILPPLLFNDFAREEGGCPLKGRVVRRGMPLKRKEPRRPPLETKEIRRHPLIINDFARKLEGVPLEEAREQERET